MFTLFVILSVIFTSQSYHVDSGFKGKIVVVSGGSSGIGFATVKELSRKGAHVVFCARDSHPTWFNGSSAEKKINSDPLVRISGGSATFFRADVRNITEVRSFIKAAHDKFGKIDHAVNNAGIGGFFSPLLNITDEMLFSEHDPLFNNLYGTLNMMREVIKYFMEHGDKEGVYSIVNTASQTAVRSLPNNSLYSASKYAIVGITKSAALEHLTTKPRIRVNAVAPGLTDTPLVRNVIKSYEGMNPWDGPLIQEDNPMWQIFKAEAEKKLAGKSIAAPSEIASVIVSLLDNAMDYATGSLVEIDNGSTAVS